MPSKLAAAGAGGTGGGDASPPEISLTRGMRYELASEEGRALLGSTTVSTIIGVAWILLVIFGPRTDVSHLLPPEERPIAVHFEEPPPPPPPPPKAEPTPAPAPKPAAPAPSAADRAKARESRRIAQAGSAFGAVAAAPGNGPVGDVSNVLRGVDVHASGSSTPGGVTGGKTVLAYGQGGQGVRTPGRTDIAGGGGGGVIGVGNVSGGGGIGHAAVAVAAPRVVDGGGAHGPGRDVGSLGDAVREHEPQLRFCYQEYGLKSNPALAGSMTLALTLDAAGAVTQTVITNRTWSGVGVAQTEGCVLEKAHAWRFPATSGASAGTFEFGFNFTK